MIAEEQVPTPRRALVVEDYGDAAQWLSAAVREAFPAVSVTIATSVAQGRELLRTVRPEFAVIDLGLPDGSGTELVALARGATPPAQVIVATVYDDDDHLFAAMRAGACGYVVKEEARETLVRQMRSVLRGELPLSPGVARRMMAYFAGSKPEEERVETLTGKEREVLALISAGATLAEAADRLGISRNTVHTHVKRVYDKLGVSTRVEATIIAARLGLIRV